MERAILARCQETTTVKRWIVTFKHIRERIRKVIHYLVACYAFRPVLTRFTFKPQSLGYGFVVFLCHSCLLYR
jgi:hypothetical protein